MTGRYLEDFAVGQIHRSGPFSIEKERIKTFAAEFDPQPFHLDENAARATIFGGWPPAGGTPPRSRCGCWSRVTSDPPAASWAPASTSSAGHGL